MELVKEIIEYVARGVEFAAALIIAIACLEGIVRSLKVFVRNSPSDEEKSQIRLNLGRWLGVALEFELAADILNTSVTPSWNEIGKLAAIATIRTALNYFLSLDVREELAVGEEKLAKEAV